MSPETYTNICLNDSFFSHYTNSFNIAKSWYCQARNLRLVAREKKFTVAIIVEILFSLTKFLSSLTIASTIENIFNVFTRDSSRSSPHA